MWALRILKGPVQGAVFHLQPGVNTIGRSPDSSIQISAKGISKNHAEIHIQESEIVVKDNNSTNGTYVNGIKIQKQTVEIGDQISFHDVVSDIVLEKQMHNLPMQGPAPVQGAYPQQMDPSFSAEPPPPEKNLIQKCLSWWEDYLKKVILPGVYKLPEWIEFKWVVAFFAIGFIILVTALSTIPLVRILKSSMETESMNHAQSIAEALAIENKSALVEGLHTSVDVQYALLRPGVKSALIVYSSTGRIIAPAEKFQTYPESPFIHRARKLGKTTVEKIDSSTVGAMVPIQYFNPDTSSQDIMAYSVVFFSLTSLTSNTNKTLSLIIQSLFIACLLGILFFFLMYKMIQYPFESLDEQLSLALKDNTATVSSRYQFPALQSLCSNINSALERINIPQDQADAMAPVINRQNEMENLVQLIGFPGLCIQLDSSSISAVNPQFEDQTGLSTEHFLNQNLDQITDTALQLNLKNAVENVTQNPSQMFVDRLELNSNPFQVTAQGVHGADQLEYILVAFIPEEAE